MILLQTHCACRHCPISLICLGDHWHGTEHRVHLRACRRCRAVYFTVENTQYVCVRMPYNGRMIGVTDGCSRNIEVSNCLEHHDLDFTARF